MLEKSSVSMMVLLVAASLIGISSIYQPSDVVTQSRKDLTIDAVGSVRAVWIYDSSEGNACVAIVRVPHWDSYEQVLLLAPNESICDLFGKAMESENELGLGFEGNGTDFSELPPDARKNLPPMNLYRVYSVMLWP